jgi:nucleotide-binding universal stress UspA family protein
MIPPTRILAAVDFSDTSRVALTMAARLARQCGAELHVLYAIDPLLAAGARSAGIDLARESREELGTFAQSASPAADWAPLHHTAEGHAAEVIGATAVREGADLVVLGAHGMSGMARMAFGSTTEAVLRHAPVSVLVVPDSWTPPQPDTADLRGTGPVVAAVDFSPVSIEAARAAARLALTLQTSLELVHVVPARPVLARWMPHAESALRQQIDVARRDLAALNDQVGAQVPVHVRAESGPVAAQLAEAAAAADGRHPLLVLGRRARAEAGYAPGETAYRALMLARVPVLLHLP